MKHKNFLSVFLSVIILLGISASHAQEAKMKKQFALNQFKQFIGIWEAEATAMLEGKPHKFQYHINFRRAADGSGLYADEWFSDSLLGTMKGANLIGYDSNTGKINWYSVDNLGTNHLHTGDWKNSDEFNMEYTEMRDGKKYTEKIRLTFKNKDELDFSLTGTLEDKEIEKLSATFFRKSLKAPEKKP
jgi:hypothetical protein